MLTRLTILLALLLAAASVASAQPSIRWTPPTAATLPAACTIGDVAGKSGADAGLYVCTITDTWTLVGGGDGGSPQDATYITHTPNASLSAEQALSTLATGLLKVTTTTGVLSTAAAEDVPDLSAIYQVVGDYGDVVGPASATDGHLAVFDGTTGKLVKDGGALGVTHSGTSCTITAIVNGIITAASCTP